MKLLQSLPICMAGCELRMCSCVLCLQNDGDSFDVAYGRFIGVLLVCTWLVVAISFMPEKMVKRIFPPLVPGVTIFLIGAALIGTGFLVRTCLGIPLCMCQTRSWV